MDKLSVAEVLERATGGAWARVFAHRVVADGECLLFTGAKLSSGYGKLSYGGNNWLAHRLSISLKQGCEARAGEIVLHECDRPSCVNPAHLRIATAQENTADMIAKGRAGWMTKPQCFKGGLPPNRYGEANGRARLTNEDAARIRHLNNNGVSYRELSLRWNVSKTTIGQICRGETYAPERTQAEVVSKLREAAALAKASSTTEGEGK